MHAASLKVLLVEDNPGDARLIQRLLPEVTAATAEVETTERLAGAVEQLSQRAFDIVLLDLSLPDSNGLDTFRQLHQTFPNLPIVVLTGHDDAQFALEAVQAGAQDYLVKGRVADDVLVRSLRYAVERSHFLEQARRAVQVRDEFLATAAHDMKTPLTAIKGYAQLLARYVRRLEGAEAVALGEGLGRIDVEASKMIGMLDELLDLARLQVGQPLQLRRAPTDLVALVRKVAADHQQATARHTIRVESALSTLIGAWDPQRVERAVDNLVVNAIKYSPAGGVVTLRLADAEGSAVLMVQDQGIGIPSADLPHVFERFRRASNATNISQGMGIGLAGVRETVERHGGTVTIESQEGAGTIVTVRLPLTLPDDVTASMLGGPVRAEVQSDRPV